MTTHTAESLALLAAVCRDPDDDLPRLVYADLLMGEGDPRGEFIAVQCELGKIPAPPPEPSVGMRSASREQRLAALMAWKKQYVGVYYQLRRRERELFIKIHGGGDKFLDADRATYALGEIEYTYRRGFVDELRLPADRWLAVADRLAWGWGPCKRCAQTGRLVLEWSQADSDGRSADCTACSGAGRVPPTMECENCGGDGEITPKNSGWSSSGPCPDCGGRWESGPHEEGDSGYSKGTGRVPRPCPETAQPIERVRLTRRPTMETPIMGWGETIFPYPGLGEVHLRDDRSEDWNLVDEERKLFEAKWPGITFELPEREV